MKWLECVKQIGITSKSGVCPHCGGSNTDYTYVLVDKTNNMGYLNVWCDDCQKLGHFSRVIIDDKNEKVISLENAKNSIPKYEVTY